MPQAKIVEIYQDEHGREPYSEWLKSRKDPIVRARIRKRVSKVEEGSFGDVEPVGQGVSELKLNFGPGYRIYFGEREHRFVILLVGGDKSSQGADIKKAKELWKEYKESK